MTESWKEPEEDNMSIGELIDWLSAIPKERQHLQVKLSLPDAVYPVNSARLSFSNGELYYAEGLLKNRTTFEGIYLEINAERLWQSNKVQQ
jgi:hypothetical protein